MGREVDVEELMEWTRQFSASGSTKRFEENVKFVFKSAFKHLRAQFGREDDDAFYSHYFGELSNREGIPLSQFRDPLNGVKVT